LAHSTSMQYRIILIPSDQGFAVGCPALPGCWSQGRTREEARRNIQEAIRLWIEVAEEDAKREAEAEQGELDEVVV
jgi:predicted RNase H-like HicB family nuclease